MDNTHQFDNKSKIYNHGRTAYADALFKYIDDNLVPKAKKVTVADVGAGTGIFTAQLLKMGYLVYAVEPNEGMRHLAEKQLGQSPNFKAVAGQAENTRLPDHGVDLITTAQAFHWFDGAAFKKECQRILKPGGYVVIAYNSRFKDENTGQLIKILRKYCPRFHGFSNQLKEKDFKAFFNNRCQIKRFANYQLCDRDKYVARVLSSSYSLSKNDSHYQDYVKELNVLGERVCKNGVIQTPIVTTAYIGKV